MSTTIKQQLLTMIGKEIMAVIVWNGGDTYYQGYLREILPSDGNQGEPVSLWIRLDTATGEVLVNAESVTSFSAMRPRI